MISAVIDIKILLFGQFGGDREQVVRHFGRAELLDYDTPLTSFVNSSFKALAAGADVAIHGGEPKYKPYITAAKKNGCKLALWGCEADWITRCHAVLPLFDLIFARDKAALLSLREAGYENIVLPKGEGDDKPQAVKTEPTPRVHADPAPLLDPSSLPTFDIPDIEPLSDPVVPTVIRFDHGLHAYGVVNRNVNVRSVSAAGGVFTLLCEEIIGRGGMVFGARFDADFMTVQSKADRMPECSPMRGVKYAFGETEGIYSQAVSYLHQGKHVLFTGIPCHVERLYAHLPPRKTDHPLLITAGIVCGGTVDPSVFAAYLKYVEEKIGARATAVDMSGKSIGSGRISARIGSENGTYDVTADRDPFLRGYRAGLFLRPECYSCPHRGERRKCDLTLGSFPGGRKHIPEFDGNKGASLVLAHTLKGRDMMDVLVRRAIVTEVPPDALAEYNPALVHVPERHKNHDMFFADMQNMRFDKAVSRSIGPALWGILTAQRSILPLWRKLTGKSKGSSQEPEQG
jgi:coenzyme F420-reducing hydrogenase beta subunit